MTTKSPSLSSSSISPSTRPIEPTHGGPQNPQHGLFDKQADEPTDADWPVHEAAAKGDNAAGAQPLQPAVERREPGHIDSALESLGEAISDPLREAAEELSNDVGKRPEPAKPGTPERRS